MHEFDEFELQRMKALLEQRYQGEDLAKIASRLGRFYSAKQVEWMLGNRDDIPAILVYEPNTETAALIDNALSDIACVIMVDNRNRIDDVCDRNIERVRLVLSAGKTQWGSQQELNMEEIRLLRHRFPGFLIVHFEEEPTNAEAFLLGQTRCDGWSNPVSVIRDDVLELLRRQGEAAKYVAYEDWVGLVCANLHLGEIDGMDWSNCIEFVLEHNRSMSLTES